MIENKEIVVGFDCSGRTTSGLNITTFSLLSPKPCSLQRPVIQTNNISVQLLETVEFQDINVFQCKIKVKRFVRRCSLLGYLEPVENGIQEYLLDISQTDCQRIHDTKSFMYDSSHILFDLKANDTTDQGVYLAGNAIDNSCNTGSFSDRYGSWSKVNVEAIISVTLNNFVAEVDLSKNKLVLRSGVVCEFDKMTCIDSEGGHTFWHPIKNVDCIIDKYNILYDGYVEKIHSVNNNISEIIYTINKMDSLFSLSEIGRFNDCGELLIRTEEPKLFIRILDNNYHNQFRQSRHKKVDLLLYMNVKTIYLEKHFREQIDNLHLSILEKRCEYRTAQLQQMLSSTNLSPDLYALNLMKKTGFMAHMAGEAVHIVQCLPTEVEVATDLSECYEQLPVYQNGQLKFLTSETRIIIDKGIEIKCNRLLPVYFRLHSRWITINPRIEDAVQKPQSVIPDIADSFVLRKIDHLATAGIYSFEDMEDFFQKLLFPIERQSLLNNVVRAMINEPVKDQTGLINLMSDNIIMSMAKKSWNLIWSDFMIFGQFSSGVMAIIYCAQVIVMITEFFIRGYILHRIFGFSVKILGAVLNSLTHLFISLEMDKKKQKKVKSSNKTTLQEIVVVPKTQVSHTFTNPAFVENVFEKSQNLSNKNVINNRNYKLYKITESSF